MALKLLQLLSAVLLLIVTGAPSAAGVINVNGSVDFVTGDGTVSLTGDRGFSFSSNPSFPSIFLSPVNSTPFHQGETIFLKVNASGNDLQGPATLDGISYPDVGSLCFSSMTTCASALIQFDGQAIAPPFGQSSTAVLVVPVTFSGSFFHHDPPSDSVVTETLVASATATLTLEKSPFLPGFWLSEGVMYDVTATPEPMTLLLLGTGTVGLGWVARRRRHARS